VKTVVQVNEKEENKTHTQKERKPKSAEKKKNQHH
jgi:hypothetical protein